MSLGSRGQPHVYVRAYIMCFVSKYHQAYITLMHIRTLCINHVTFKVHEAYILVYFEYLAMHVI